MSGKFGLYKADNSPDEPARNHFASTRWATNVGPIRDDILLTLLNTHEAMPFQRFVTLNLVYGANTLDSEDSVSDASAIPARAPGIDIGIRADAASAAGGEAASAWALELWNSIHADRYPGYPSVLEDEGAARIAASNGPNYSRLRKLKANYDPGNLLRSNQNVPPQT